MLFACKLEVNSPNIVRIGRFCISIEEICITRQHRNIMHQKQYMKSVTVLQNFAELKILNSVAAMSLKKKKKKGDYIKNK